MYIIVSLPNHQLALGDLLRHMRVSDDTLHLNLSMVMNCGIKSFGLAYIVAHIVANGAEEMSDISVLLLTRRDSARNATARTMTEYKQKFHTEVLDCVVDTTHNHLAVDIVSGGTDNENITDTLVEKQLYWYTRVRTAHHSGKWSLVWSGLGYSCHIRVRMDALASHITIVSDNQLCQRLLRC